MGAASSEQQAAASQEEVAAAAPVTETKPTEKTVETPKAPSPKASPKKQAASPKASPKAEPKASPKAAPKAEPKAAPKAEAAAAAQPLPPGKVKADGAPAEAEGEKKGRGKGKKEQGEKGGGKKEQKPTGQKQTSPAVGNKLCVKNLPDDTTSDSLKAMFATHGAVSEADAKMKDDKCRGFGFVTMSSSDEAAKAMAALSGHKIGGKELLVLPAEKREKKEDTGKGKGKDKGTGGKGAEKGSGKGKDSKGKGKGKEVQLASSMPPPTSAPMPQTASNPYATNAAYMQAYYQQYQPYIQQQYYNAYGMGYAQHQYMNQQYAQYAAAAAAAQPQAYQTPQVASYAGNLKPGEYEGSLKSVSDKHGYGFIACEETYKKYRRDVYVSKDSLPAGAKVLDRIRFTITVLEKEKTGRDGTHVTEERPTAENVRMVSTTGAAFAQSS